MKVTLAIAGVMSFVLLTSSISSAQKLPKSIYIQAQAMGQSTQLGQTFGVTLIIQEYSTADDQKALLGAFNEKQNEGLVNALTKMNSKGRLSITGTLGYEVTYIRQFPLPDGSTKIRLVTNRPIRFGEAWSDSRSMDYNLSAMEIILFPDKKKNSGTLLPACQFKIDKENQLQIELLQNAWKLVDIMKR
jgi:pyrroline-5-carboxylate reductase